MPGCCDSCFKNIDYGNSIYCDMCDEYYCYLCYASESSYDKEDGNTDDDGCSHYSLNQKIFIVIKGLNSLISTLESRRKI